MQFKVLLLAFMASMTMAAPLAVPTGPADLDLAKRLPSVEGDLMEREPKINPGGTWRREPKINPGGTWKREPKINPGGTWKREPKINPGGTWRREAKINPGGTWKRDLEDRDVFTGNERY